MHNRGTSGYATDPSGKRALSAVLGKPLSMIEEDWRKWLKQLKLPWGEARSMEGRLGLWFQNTRRGVKVVGMIEGGAAQRAGRLRIGDIIKAGVTLVLFGSGDETADAETVGSAEAPLPGEADLP